MSANGAKTRITLAAGLILLAAFSAVDPSQAQDGHRRSGISRVAAFAESLPPRLDRYGDPLPDGALARLGTVRFRFGNYLHALCLSTDGKLLAGAGGHSVNHLWEVPSGKERLRLIDPQETGLTYSVAFSPDATLLATSAWHNVVLWDATTGKLLRRLRFQLAKALAFSPNGKVLASAAHEVALWDQATGKRLPDLEEHRGPIVGSSSFRSLAFSKDDRLLAAACVRAVLLWDMDTGKQLAVLEGHREAVSAVAFSPDGSLLASSSDDRTIRLWDPAAKKLVRELKGAEACVRCLAFSPDGRTLAGGAGYGRETESAPVRLWDVATGEEKPRLRELGDQDDFPDGLAWVGFTPDGKTLLVAGGGCVRLWDLESGKERQPFEGHRHWVGAVAFAPDGRTLASGGADGVIRIWDPETARELRQLRGCKGAVDSLDFSPDGKLLASGSREGGVRLWDPETGQELHRFKSHHAQAIAAFSPDGKQLASGGFEGNIIIWDVATAKPVHQFAATAAGLVPRNVFGFCVRSIAFSPDGVLLATGHETRDLEKQANGIWLWDV